MKRLITAISLLTIAGILCGIGFLSMKKQVDTLTQLFHEGAQAAQAEDEERLHTCTKELQKAWEKKPCRFFYAESSIIDLDEFREQTFLDLNNLLKEKVV